MRRGWSRRAAIGAALGLPAFAAAATEAEPRVVSLDWGLAMTTLGLGATPVGIAEQRLYGAWVRTPPIPPGVAEVGLRNAPSFETLAALRPELILVNLLNTAALPRLTQIAPVEMNTIFAETRTPLARARRSALHLGARLGRAAAADRFVADADATIAVARGRVAGLSARAVVPLNAVDGRHVTVYGPGSLYHDVLVALGLRTASIGPTSLWGYRTIGMAEISALLPADLLVIAPLPAHAATVFDGPGLWRSLLAAGKGRQMQLPPAWAYGDIGSAARFATLTADALTGVSG